MHHVPQKSINTNRPRRSLRNSHLSPFRSFRAKFSSVSPVSLHEGIPPFNKASDGNPEPPPSLPGRPEGPELILTVGSVGPFATSSRSAILDRSPLNFGPPPAPGVFAPGGGMIST